MRIKLYLKSFFLLLLFSTIIPALTLSAEEPTFTADYYNNITLEGEPILTRNESTIDFNWGYNSPDPAVNSDYFSARYTANHNFTEGTYVFKVTADDGVKLYVDDVLHIDKWKNQPPTTYTAEVNLTEGTHKIEIEYYENTVGAYLQFEMKEKDTSETPTPTPSVSSDKYTASYYSNSTFSGEPTIQEQIDTIDYSWEYSSPHPSIPTDQFSVKWTKNIEVSEGFHKFTAFADDGVRVLVDGNIILDGWKNQPVTEYTNYAYLTAGQHSLTIEYYEQWYGATVRFNWEPVSAYSPSKNSVIMPLGDSITHGWNVPGGYRNQLASVLSDTDFVGTQNNGPSSLSDKDHEGHLGWRVDEINANIQGWLSYYSPDTVLIMLGTNDIHQQYNVSTLPNRMSSLIDNIHSESPNANIYLASIPPLSDGNKNANVNTYNSQLPAIVEAKRQQGINIYFVDVNAKLTLSDIDPDGIHPNEIGYNKIADAWISALGNESEEPTPLPPPPSSDGDFTAQYFSNIHLTGQPVLTRNEPSIDYIWGYDSPGPGVPSDFFSARWSGSFISEDDTYTFEVKADDGVRLYVDGDLIIDQWKDQGPTVYKEDISLEAGEHTIVMEYYERWVGAVAQLKWYPSTISDTSNINLIFNAEYFNNTNLQGNPVLTREENEINYNFGYGSPHPSVSDEYFSARWSSSKVLEAGTYQFSTTTDDGVRLYVDGDMIIDDWNDHGNLTHVRELVLEAGEHEIIMEYYEHWVGAFAQFSLKKIH